MNRLGGDHQCDRQTDGQNYDSNNMHLTSALKCTLEKKIQMHRPNRERTHSTLAMQVGILLLATWTMRMSCYNDQIDKWHLAWIYCDVLIF